MSEQNPTQTAQPDNLKVKTPGRGFRIWAVVLLVLAINNQGGVFLMAAKDQPLLALCVFLSIVLGPAIAYMWYRLSLKRPLAHGLRYGLGCFLHGAGTFIVSNLAPLVILSSFLVAQMKRVEPLIPATVHLHSKLFLASMVFLITSFLLCFKRSGGKE